MTCWLASLLVVSIFIENSAFILYFKTDLQLWNISIFAFIRPENNVLLSLFHNVMREPNLSIYLSFSPLPSLCFSLFLSIPLSFNPSPPSFNIYISLFNIAYIYIYKVHTISFQTFFVWAFLLIVHLWNSSLLRSYLLQLQCTCFTIPTTSGRPHGSPHARACQWPSSQPLLSPQLSHNNLWA